MLALRALLRTHAGGPLLTRFYATPASSKKKKKPKVDPNALPLADALALIKALEAGRPHNRLQLSIRYDSAGANAKLRSTIALPRPITKSKKTENRVLVFAEGDKAEEARLAGASIVGGKELIERIQGGEVVYGRHIRTAEGELLKFDKVISTTDMFPQVIKIAKILASMQQMPQAKRGTVTNDIEKAVIFQAREGCDLFGDGSGNVSAVIGNIDFPLEDVQGNVRAVLNEMRMYGEAQRIKKVLGKVVLHGGHSPAIPLADVSRM